MRPKLELEDKPWGPWWFLAACHWLDCHSLVAVQLWRAVCDGVKFLFFIWGKKNALFLSYCKKSAQKSLNLNRMKTGQTSFSWGRWMLWCTVAATVFMLFFNFANGIIWVFKKFQESWSSVFSSTYSTVVSTPSPNTIYNSTTLYFAL